MGLLLEYGKNQIGKLLERGHPIFTEAPSRWHLLAIAGAFSTVMRHVG